MIRVDISRPHLLRAEPAIRVYVGDRIRFVRLAELPGGRVVQDGTSAWVELSVRVDELTLSGDAPSNAGS